MNRKLFHYALSALAAVITILIVVGRDIRIPAALFCALTCFKHIAEANSRPDWATKALIEKTCDGWLKDHRLSKDEQVKYLQSLCYEYMSWENE